jgi:hypothetical protein
MATFFLYQRPARDLAIEAAVVGAVAFGTNVEGGPVSARVVANIVGHHFPWSRRTEIHRTLARLADVGRVQEERAPGRTLPLYVLP